MHINSKMVSIWLVLALCLVTSSCTRTCKINTDLRMPDHQMNKIPLHVGLYLPPDFANYTCKISGVNTDLYVFDLGEVLKSGSNQMLNIAFQSVTILSSPENIVDQEIQVIVTPQVQEIDMIIPGWAFKQLKSLVIIKWEFTDPKGKILWVDTFEGRGQNRVGYFMRGKAASKCMKRGVEDHFANALEGILQSKWWKSIDHS